MAGYCDILHQRDQLLEENKVLLQLVEQGAKMDLLTEQCAKTGAELAEFKAIFVEKMNADKKNKRLAKQSAQIASLGQTVVILKESNQQLVEKAAKLRFDRDRLVGDLEVLAQLPLENAAVIVLQRKIDAVYAKMERDHVAYIENVREKTASMQKVLEMLTELRERTDTLEEHFNATVVALGALTRKPAGQKTKTALDALFHKMRNFLIKYNA